MSDAHKQFYVDNNEIPRMHDFENIEWSLFFFYQTSDDVEFSHAFKWLLSACLTLVKHVLNRLFNYIHSGAFRPMQ